MVSKGSLEPSDQLGTLFVFEVLRDFSAQVPIDPGCHAIFPVAPAKLTARIMEIKFNGAIMATHEFKR